MHLQKVFTLAEVKKHNKEDDCWIIVNGGVYDVTKFAKFHPGGKKILLKEVRKWVHMFEYNCIENIWNNKMFLLIDLPKGGKDSSKKFKMFHGPHVLKKYDKKLKIGNSIIEPIYQKLAFFQLIRLPCKTYLCDLHILVRSWFFNFSHTNTACELKHLGPLMIFHTNTACELKTNTKMQAQRRKLITCSISLYACTKNKSRSFTQWMRLELYSQRLMIDRDHILLHDYIVSHERHHWPSKALDDVARIYANENKKTYWFQNLRNTTSSYNATPWARILDELKIRSILRNNANVHAGHVARTCFACPKYVNWI